MNIYFAACDENGGIYRYIYENGTLSFAEKTPLNKPMFISFDGDKMWVCLKGDIENGVNSSALSFDVSDGKPKAIGGEFSTEGLCGCHIASRDGDVYVANYMSGSVKKLGGKLDVHEGVGVNLPRQSAPHTHQCVITPDGNSVLVTDLGLDTVFVYDRDLNLKSKAFVPKGHGCRHLCFGENGLIYCVNELSATVTVFEFDGQTLIPLETYPTLPEGFSGKNTAAAIRIHNGRLYVSNRGHDSIEQLKIEGKALRLLSSTPCGGEFPRDFDITPDGKLLLCTNENTNSVTVFEIDGENLNKLDTELPMPNPLCVVFRK